MSSEFLNFALVCSLFLSTWAIGLSLRRHYQSYVGNHPLREDRRGNSLVYRYVASNLLYAYLVVHLDHHWSLDTYGLVMGLNLLLLLAIAWSKRQQKVTS